MLKTVIAAPLLLARLNRAAAQIAGATTRGVEQLGHDAEDGRRDFDFLIGCWQIKNRRLARRLRGSQSWQEFDAQQEVRSVLGGLGNVDRFWCTFPDGKPLEGMTLRLFDPASKLWSLYWADNRSGQLQPPVVGRFANGRGEFHGDDTFEGKPIRVVFHWTDITAHSAKWDQAFSADGGKTWETNWHMAMTRQG